MERIESRLDPGKALYGEEEMAKVCSELQPAPAVFKTYAEMIQPLPGREEVYERSLAEQWRETACADDGAPFVLQAILPRLDESDVSPFAPRSPEKAKLAAAFLDTEHCPGARGLSQDEIAKLKAIRDRANPQEPKASESAPPPPPIQ